MTVFKLIFIIKCKVYAIYYNLLKILIIIIILFNSEKKFNYLSICSESPVKAIKDK